MTFWTRIAWALTPGLMMLLAFAPVILILFSWGRKRKRLQRKSPLTRDMLRPPGHSLREKIDEALEQYVLYGVMCVAVPLVLYAMVTSYSYFGGEAEKAPSPYIFIILALVAAVVLAFKMIAALERKRTYALGLSGELATGEELNQLMLHGCRVFHDVPAKKWGNVDHVVVAPTGVFAVETKTREKRKDADLNWKMTVDYGRGVLKFPGWEEPIPTEQAQWQAKELGDWLSQAVGSPVKVSLIIALPGWFIDKIGSRTVPVINPANSHNFFLKQSGDRLTPERVTQIAHHLDYVCRDVPPPNKGERGGGSGVGDQGAGFGFALRHRLGNPCYAGRQPSPWPSPLKGRGKLIEAPGG